MPIINGIVSQHKVNSGESLSVIAHNYGTTTANLMKWNSLKSSKVFVGQELKVASPGAASSNGSSTNVRSTGYTTVTHVVKSGDYLGKIAEQYSVSVSSIKQQNNLRSNTLKGWPEITNQHSGEKRLFTK